MIKIKRTSSGAKLDERLAQVEERLEKIEAHSEKVVQASAIGKRCYSTVVPPVALHDNRVENDQRKLDDEEQNI
ncbi:hypothetical protein MTR67_018919 [Solanum verrucosum]|uniref:Uncharacterized protein n=1 Tax=Solanum verrucosum TaxID=315347 RepID=A0AAF0QT90_SOLVR|nr:hypothetical protein MTR67_018919 [Solanum verrucosum]